MGNRVDAERLRREKIKAELENRTFAERYELAAKEWFENTGTQPPLYRDPKTNKLLWRNRAERRKAKR